MCAAASPAGRTIEPGILEQALREFTRRPVPSRIGLQTYRMHRCPACSLEFADPMKAAPDAFYEWLDQGGAYYLENRWEWDEVSKLIGAHGRCSVLEIGAGDGRLLSRLRAGGATVAAVERSMDAAGRLQKMGIEAWTPADAERHQGRTFDYVLAFHCLEHVENPLAVMRSMLASAGPRGTVLFSVPYSPMYFEGSWFDPLNHPPHHLTRWNQRSLRELARRAGGRAELFLPTALGPVRRARYSLALRHLGVQWSRHPGWQTLPLRKPWQFLRELKHQLARERIGGTAAADVVLVKVTALA